MVRAIKRLMHWLFDQIHHERKAMRYEAPGYILVFGEMHLSKFVSKDTIYIIDPNGGIWKPMTFDGFPPPLTFEEMLNNWDTAVPRPSCEEPW